MEPLDFVVNQSILAIIVGFGVEALKRAGMKSKYAFLAAGVSGSVLGLIASFTVSPLSVSNAIVYILAGIIAGASASGFYSGGKKYNTDLKK